MPDDPFSSQERDPEEFFRGLNFLGRPSSVTLPGQEPSPPGGALSAGVGAPAAPSATGAPGSAGVGLPGAGLSPGLQALMTGLSFANRASNLPNLFSGAPSAGAFETPSGQLTTSAPEILRDIQFPGSDVSPAGQALSTQLGGGEGSFLGDIGSQISGLFGQAAPYTGPVLSLIQGILNRDPVGITGAGLGGLAAAGEGTALGGELAGALGATGPGWAGPALSAASVIANIIRDEISDPQGRRSMAENVNFQESQQVPGDVGALGAGAGILPFVSNPANLSGLSTEQLMQLYATAAGGIRGADYLADPLAQSGRTEAGITHPSFPGLSEGISQMRPESIQATLLLDQEIARRGLDPSSFTIGASGDPTGAFRLNPEKLWFEMFGGAGPQGGGGEADPGPGAGQAQQAAAAQAYQDFLNQSIYMDPATLQGMLGPNAGMFGAPPMQAQAPPMGGDVAAAPFGSGTVFPWEQT